MPQNEKTIPQSGVSKIPLSGMLSNMVLTPFCNPNYTPSMITHHNSTSFRTVLPRWLIGALLVLTPVVAQAQTTLFYDNFAGATQNGDIITSPTSYGTVQYQRMTDTPRTYTLGDSLVADNGQSIRLGETSPTNRTDYFIINLPQPAALLSIGDYVQLDIVWRTAVNPNGNRNIRYGIYEGAANAENSRGYLLAGHPWMPNLDESNNSTFISDPVGGNRFTSTATTDIVNTEATLALGENEVTSAMLRITRSSSTEFTLSGFHHGTTLPDRVFNIAGANTPDEHNIFDQLWFGVTHRQSSFDIDSITVTIPEPGTIALPLGIGLICLILRIRRCRQVALR